jgi:hypothetical protein
MKKYNVVHMYKRSCGCGWHDWAEIVEINNFNLDYKISVPTNDNVNYYEAIFISCMLEFFKGQKVIILEFHKAGSSGFCTHVWNWVARWFISVKIIFCYLFEWLRIHIFGTFSVFFWISRPFVIVWYILWPFGILCGRLAYIIPFW